MAHRNVRSIARSLPLLLVLALVALPAEGKGGRPVSDRVLNHLSSSAVSRYWMANPGRAPEQLKDRFRALNRAIQAGVAVVPPGGGLTAFNEDVFGLPQNEESVDVCENDPSLVIEGTNDYRGLLDPEGNFTGWHLSTNGGASLSAEGLLPPVSEGGDVSRASGGDPVYRFATDGSCAAYAASLNYDPVAPFGNTNGIGIYMSDAATLTSPTCGDDGPSDADCWPVRRYAGFSADPTHFFDKEWFDVGDTGDGPHVWVSWSDFDIAAPNPAGFTAEILAARCEADLSSCTAPIPISEDDVDVQFSYPSIGPDGRTYLTWAQIFGEIEGTAQTFVIKMRVAEPGSTVFGPEQIVFEETLAIPFGGFLHANDFRVATVPKNAVRTVDGATRVFVIWDACTHRPLDTVCEEAAIKLSYSDDQGATWSTPTILSAGGDNYFPSIANDAAGPGLMATWFTNRGDPAFHNRQDVELVAISPQSGQVTRRSLIGLSNESEADPLLGGFFIGDYIEVAAFNRVAYVGFNANSRFVQLLFEGVPVPQQDNFLVRRVM